MTDPVTDPVTHPITDHTTAPMRSGPARAGLFIYAVDAERIADFYVAVTGLARMAVSNGLIVLGSADIQLLVHPIPAMIAREITITTPPERREEAALKFFLTVPNLSVARATAATLGGAVYEENWPGPGFIVCNAMDPEGNVFQLREPAATA